MTAARETSPELAPMPPHEAGFTLLEMLVSLVLIALLMVAMPQALTFARRTQSAAAALDREAAIDAAASFIEHRLAEATAIYDRGDDGRLHVIFHGDPNAISFVAPIAFSAREAGLARLDVGISDDGNSRSGLKLTWRSWRPPAVGEQSAVIVPPQSRLIVTDATAFDLRYYGVAAGEDKPDWTDTWSRPDAIPDLVEFRITRPGLAVRIRTVPLKLRLP